MFKVLFNKKDSWNFKKMIIKDDIYIPWSILCALVTMCGYLLLEDFFMICHGDFHFIKNHRIMAKDGEIQKEAEDNQF